MIDKFFELVVVDGLAQSAEHPRLTYGTIKIFTLFRGAAVYLWWLHLSLLVEFVYPGSHFCAHHLWHVVVDEN